MVTRSQRLDALMRVFMIKIPNPDGSATQFQLRFLDISNPSRRRLDPPESSEEQNCPKSTHTEFLKLCQSQFGSIRRMYHELREKEEALQN
ncbi:hypothetical protein T07_14405, partial [Trichinella nelsoni]